MAVISFTPFFDKNVAFMRWVPCNGWSTWQIVYSYSNSCLDIYDWTTFWEQFCIIILNTNYPSKNKITYTSFLDYYFKRNEDSMHRKAYSMFSEITWELIIQITDLQIVSFNALHTLVFPWILQETAHQIFSYLFQERLRDHILCYALLLLWNALPPKDLGRKHGFSSLLSLPGGRASTINRHTHTQNAKINRTMMK